MFHEKCADLGLDSLSRRRIMYIYDFLEKNIVTSNLNDLLIRKDENKTIHIIQKEMDFAIPLDIANYLFNNQCIH